MPLSCCVPYCNQEGYKDEAGNKVSFHDIPKELEARKLWLTAIWKKDHFVSQKRVFKVCSKHFKPDDFLPRITSGRHILREGAVPSKFWRKRIPGKGPKRRKLAKEGATSRSADQEAASQSPPTRESSPPIQTQPMRTYGKAMQERLKREGLTLILPEPEFKPYAQLPRQCLGPAALKMLQPLRAPCRTYSDRPALRPEEEIPDLDPDPDNLAPLCELLVPKQEEPSLEEHACCFQRTEECERLCAFRAEMAALRAELESAQKRLELAERDLASEHAELKAKKDECYRVAGNLQFWKRRVEKLEAHNDGVFSLERFRDNPGDVLFYTGLPSYEHAAALFNFLQPGANGENVAGRRGQLLGTAAGVMGRPRSLTVHQEYFLVLVRLRVGYLERDLADRFNIRVATVSSIFTTWVRFMHTRLSKLPLWPSREVADMNMPPQLKELCPGLRIILGATDIKFGVPSNTDFQSDGSSTTKLSYVMRGLLGVAPCGSLAFVSELFPGETSDRELVQRSGLLDKKFQPGDVVVMGDKAFRVDRAPTDDSVEPEEAWVSNAEIALREEDLPRKTRFLKCRVVRKINRIKSFRLLDGLVPVALAPLMNQVWSTCAILTNFHEPMVIIQQDESESV